MTIEKGESFELLEDSKPEGFNETSPLRCQFDGCSNSVVKPSRGRTPKFCPEHAGNKTISASGTTRRNSWPEADAVEELLTNYFNGLGFAVCFINPADGEIIAEGGPAVAKALIDLARADKKLRTILTKLTTPGKYGPLIMALSGIILPIAINHGLLPEFMAAPKKKGV